MTLGEFREATKDVHDSARLVMPDGLDVHVHDVSCGQVWLSDVEDEHTCYCRTCRQPLNIDADITQGGTLLAGSQDEP